MHANQCTADVDTGICFDEFDHCRLVQMPISIRRHCSACVTDRHYSHLIKMALSGHTPFDDKGPVKMLTALKSKLHTCCFLKFFTLAKNHFSDIHCSSGADFFTDHFTGA